MSLIDILFILMILISAIGFSFGVNLRHWLGWIQIFFGFLAGVIVAWGEGLFAQTLTGLFFMFLTMWIGNIRWRQRKC